MKICCAVSHIHDHEALQYVTVSLQNHFNHIVLLSYINYNTTVTFYSYKSNICLADY